MKKRIMFFIIVLLIILGGYFGYQYAVNKDLITITMDINPSIEIKMTKDSIVKKVKALNKDAKDVITGNYKGKNVKIVLSSIADNLVEKGYAGQEELVMLVYSEGELDNGEFDGLVRETFNKIRVEVIRIDNISKEDERLARKYDITAAKAAYINSIAKEDENISISDLVNKKTSELREMRDSGFYCDSGFTLEGSRCLKEKYREDAQYGKTCSNGMVEYEGKCYEHVDATKTNEYICNADFSLSGTNCIGKETVEAKGDFSCSSGNLIKREHARYKKYRDSGDPNQYVCEDTSNAKKPTLRCLTNPGHIMINGKCANGPAPLINGGCPGNDRVVNGGCYSIDDEDQWICPDGAIYEKSKDSYTELCPDTFKYTVASGTYKCESEYTLKGSKCIKDIIEEARPKYTCPNNYLLDGDRCLNPKSSTNMKDGYFCEKPQSHLEGNICIIYEEVDAHRMGE